MDPRRERMRKQFATAALTCGSLVTSLPLLAFVTWVVLGDGSPDNYTPLAEILPIATAFGLLAATAVGVSFWVMPFLLRAGAAAAERGSADSLDGYAASMMIANLTSSAVSEIPLLLGFVLTIMTGQWFTFLAGAAVTASLWAIHFPRFSRWERLLSAEEARRSGAPRIVS